MCGVWGGGGEGNRIRAEWCVCGNGLCVRSVRTACALHALNKYCASLFAELLMQLCMQACARVGMWVAVG